jgi:hypothetical protein
MFSPCNVICPCFPLIPRDSPRLPCDARTSDDSPISLTAAGGSIAFVSHVDRVVRCRERIGEIADVHIGGVPRESDNLAAFPGQAHLVAFMVQD